MDQKPVSTCEFCLRSLDDKTAYHLVAWQAVADQLDGPGFEFQLCQECYYEICWQVVQHREHILKLQSRMLDRQTAVHGIKV